MAESDSKEETKASPAIGEEPSAAPATAAQEESEISAQADEAPNEEETTPNKEEEEKNEKTNEKSVESEPAAKKQKTEEKTSEDKPKEENAEAYEIDEAPETPSTDDEKITSPAVVLFGLHPLIKEAPLSKLLKKYGTLKTCSVRMAFASRYGTVEFETTDEAKAAYRALNNAKIMGKPVLVQPTAVKKE